MAKNYSLIRDAVHGFIKVSPLEMEIIDTMPFQRLRNIKQLAFTNLVYPGTEHSRFSHSLGVMEFATKVFDVIIAKHQKCLDWDERRVKKNRQLLRLASLLHDIGHSPFSHASEELIDESLGSHEEYVAKIIEDTSIKDIIDRLPKEAGTEISSKNIIDFFKGETIEDDIGDIAFLREIYAGEVDADRMDYLLRDSLFAGVHYGKFDQERLIQSLCLVNPPGEGSPVLAIEEGGKHALEALILARYFMFTQVYFHKVRRSYDLHLKEFLKEKVGKYPVDTNEYLGWDDIKVLQIMREDKSNDNGQRILNRNHFVEVFSTPEHSTEEEKIRFMSLKGKAAEEFKDIRVFFDEAEKGPHKFETTDFYIQDKRGNIELINKASHIIAALKKIQEFRVYTSNENGERVKKFCEEFWYNGKV